MPNPPGSNIENKFPQNRITGEAALDAYSNRKGSERKFQISVQKEHLRQNRLADSINEHCSELPENLRQQLLAFCEKYGGRLPIHIYRLLNNERSQTENNFGQAILTNYEPIRHQLELIDQEISDQAPDDAIPDRNIDRLDDVMGSESIDSGMFWTFAPYLYKHLLLKGTEPSAAINRIITWSLRNNFDKNKLINDRLSCHLKGLSETWLELDGRTYYLTSDENDATHTYTDQEAHKLVEQGIV